MKSLLNNLLVYIVVKNIVINFLRAQTTSSCFDPNLMLIILRISKLDFFKIHLKIHDLIMQVIVFKLYFMNALHYKLCTKTDSLEYWYLFCTITTHYSKELSYVSHVLITPT